MKSAFDVRMIEEKPIVVRAHKKLNIVGDEIVSINGVDFLNIVDTMTKYHYHGGNDINAQTGILTSKYFYHYFSFFMISIQKNWILFWEIDMVHRKQ